MALPVNAKVETAPNFLTNLAAAHTKLKADLREMAAILAWSPGSGRPARFMSAKSAQARLKTAAIVQLAEQAGLHHLRKYIVDQHIVLYAHADNEVVLLAIKHQRQLVYSTEA